MVNLTSGRYLLYGRIPRRGMLTTLSADNAAAALSLPAACSAGRLVRPEAIFLRRQQQQVVGEYWLAEFWPGADVSQHGAVACLDDEHAVAAVGRHGKHAAAIEAW